MKGIAIALVVVVGIALVGSQVVDKGDSGLPNVPPAPLIVPADSSPVQTRRLDIVGDDGKVGMFFTVEGGISYVTVNDNGKQRKIDLTKLARRL